MADTLRYVDVALSWSRKGAGAVAVLTRAADDASWSEIGRTDGIEFTATGLHPERSHTFAVAPIEEDGSFAAESEWETLAMLPAELQGMGLSAIHFVGSDVGGGTHLSLHRALADAYKVQALQGTRLPAWKALYSATRGAARALGLEHEMGSFDVGCCADLALWRWAHGPVHAVRDAAARGLHERLFAWTTLADERNLSGTWVAGQRLYRSETP